MLKSSRAAAPGRWVVRGVTFALWLLAAASAVWWGLRLSAPVAVSAGAAPTVRPPVATDPLAVARLLGHVAQGEAQAPAVSLSSRFALHGVVAGVSQQGAALIAVDGKPARPFRVGARVDEGLMLQSVHGRRAVLAASQDGPAVLTLEMPPLKP